MNTRRQSRNSVASAAAASGPSPPCSAASAAAASSSPFSAAASASASASALALAPPPPPECATVVSGGRSASAAARSLALTSHISTTNAQPAGSGTGAAAGSAAPSATPGGGLSASVSSAVRSRQRFADRDPRRVGRCAEWFRGRILMRHTPLLDIYHTPCQPGTTRRARARPARARPSRSRRAQTRTTRAAPVEMTSRVRSGRLHHERKITVDRGPLGWRLQLGDVGAVHADAAAHAVLGRGREAVELAGAAARVAHVM